MASAFSLRRLLGRKEDHLTAMFGLALELDSEFRRRVSDMLLAGLSRVDNAAPAISEIEMQRSFDDGHCCPDLVLTLADGRTVLVENKLEAPETLGLEGASPMDSVEAPKKQPQLKRYLKLPDIAGVAFIRSTRKSVDPAVLADPRYLAPTWDAQHFLWRDLFPLLDGSEHPVTLWLRNAFVECAFTPPIAEIGDLADPERRRNVAKLLEPAAEAARKAGWEVGTGSISELYLSGNARSVADLVWVNPTTEALIVRLRPREPTELGRVRAAALGAQGRLQRDYSAFLELAKVKQVAGLREVVDLRLPFASLLARTASVSEREGRLQEVVDTVLAELALADATP